MKTVLFNFVTSSRSSALDLMTLALQIHETYFNARQWHCRSKRVNRGYKIRKNNAVVPTCCCGWFTPTTAADRSACDAQSFVIQLRYGPLIRGTRRHGVLMRRRLKVHKLFFKPTRHRCVSRLFEAFLRHWHSPLTSSHETTNPVTDASFWSKQLHFLSILTPITLRNALLLVTRINKLNILSYVFYCTCILH